MADPWNVMKVVRRAAIHEKLREWEAEHGEIVREKFEAYRQEANEMDYTGQPGLDWAFCQTEDWIKTLPPKLEFYFSE